MKWWGFDLTQHTSYKREMEHHLRVFRILINEACLRKLDSFYIPGDTNCYPTMDECVAIHGSGRLVANQKLLDDKADLEHVIRERDAAMAEVERLKSELAELQDGKETMSRFLHEKRMEALKWADQWAQSYVSERNVELIECIQGAIAEYKGEK